MDTPNTSEMKEELEHDLFNDELVDDASFEFKPKVRKKAKVVKKDNLNFTNSYKSNREIIIE